MGKFKNLNSCFPTQFDGTDYSFFKVSWGVVGQYPTVVQTPIKSLIIDALGQNVPYALQVDAYFAVDGKDVAKTFANVSFGPITGETAEHCPVRETDSFAYVGSLWLM